MPLVQRCGAGSHTHEKGGTCIALHGFQRAGRLPDGEKERAGMADGTLRKDKGVRHIVGGLGLRRGFHTEDEGILLLANKNREVTK